ncbi:hypothetical protein Hanom_Chr08g00705641 [Helianthus anomalus]
MRSLPSKHTTQTNIQPFLSLSVPLCNKKKRFQLSDSSPPSDYIPTIGFYRQPDKRRFSPRSIFVTPTHLFFT